jgi:hypothetical protein
VQPPNRSSGNLLVISLSNADEFKTIFSDGAGRGIEPRLKAL